VAAVETPTEVRAEARYVRTAPRKAQLIADQIRGRTVPEARTILTFMTRDAAGDVARVLESAVANAEANHGLSGDELYVSAAYVGAGPTLKRWRARARGRVARIKKRTCHITVRLAMPDHAEIPLTPVAPPPEPIAPPEPEEQPAAEEEEPKAKRAPRKTADEATEKEKSTTTAEKPKRTRARKADATEATEATEDKPKRTTRKKRESEES
jgi:large subunit ribosomal protein L22